MSTCQGSLSETACTTQFLKPGQVTLRAKVDYERYHAPWPHFLTGSHYAGSRLTAYELVHDGLPATLIADSAAASLMAQRKVDAIVVGADRIAANGDTANKIGTFSLAVNAAHHG